MGLLELQPVLLQATKNTKDSGACLSLRSCMNCELRHTFNTNLHLAHDRLNRAPCLPQSRLDGVNPIPFMSNLSAPFLRIPGIHQSAAINGFRSWPLLRFQDFQNVSGSRFHHCYVTAAFHVQADYGLCIGHANIKPPLRELKTVAVGVVHLECVLGILFI